MPRDHVVGLLLGAEEDWPAAFESLMRRVATEVVCGAETHRFSTERVTIEPFDLRAQPRYGLVIDRLSWWYSLPREWLKKVALMNDVHLLNNPFTFQAMEKHAAYCAMMRLGLRVPTTWMIPHKLPPDNPRMATTAERYLRPFALEQLADEVGLPLYMKPFDGGAWVGVTRIDTHETLRRAYDESAERLMHLQASVEGFDTFARSLGIGAETIVLQFHPDRPMHSRYAVAHNFLSAEQGEEVVSIARTVNAFFRWELNSCETLLRDGLVHPIDYANATPDLAVTSLHYYFPWAIRTLVKWTVFCCVTGRRPTVDLDTRRYFAIADEPGISYEDKLREYRRLADEQLEVERYNDFVATHLAHVDEACVAWVESDEFDAMLVDTVRSTYPAHEQDEFLAHLRGLTGAWAHDQRAPAPSGAPAPPPVAS
ncbi:MAG: ATP-grasp domain-containing protein [Candidatus Dormibacteria bacterium]